ncbi:unnamed protein product [Mytilus coruscus]|uniref:C-type lectin domain-containing protein n=1 Tax=Mytilus coruscus TaxID=42192 RepID=A0A6J8F531_MYTCO|nr:unnamed protein product [Mytilus coruscus]
MCSDTCIANNICPHTCGKCYNCLSCDEIESPDKCNTTTECNYGKVSPDKCNTITECNDGKVSPDKCDTTTECNDGKVSPDKCYTTTECNYGKVSPDKCYTTTECNYGKVSPDKCYTTTECDYGKVSPDKCNTTTECNDGKVSPDKCYTTTECNYGKVSPDKCYTTTECYYGKVSPDKCYTTTECNDGKVSPDKCYTTTECNYGKVSPDKCYTTTECNDGKTCQKFHTSVTDVFGKRQSFTLQGRCCIGEKCNSNLTSAINLTPSQTSSCSTTVRQCPVGFYLYDNICYHLGNTSLDKTHAKNYCRKQCSNLAEFNTFTPEHMKQFFQYTSRLFHISSGEEFQAYVGIEDVNQSGSRPKWIWEVSGQTIIHGMQTRFNPTHHTFCMVAIHRIYSSDNSYIAGLANVDCSKQYKPLCQIKLS